MAELELIDQIIEKVRESAIQRSRQPDVSRMVLGLEIEIEELHIERIQANDRLEFVMEQLDEIQKLHEQGQISTLQVSEYRLEVKQAEAEVRKASLRVERVERQLAAFKGGAKSQEQR